MITKGFAPGNDTVRRAARDGSRPLPTLPDVEAAIGIPAADWAGHCHETACAIVEAGLVDGVAVYGEWLGPIAEGGHFDAVRGRPFHHHGWIALRDGRVLDPTRWAFEGKEPYLYVGPSGPEYDEGGNRWRALTLEPPPAYRRGDRAVSTEGLSEPALHFMRELLGGPRNITMPMLVWLANLPLDTLGPLAGDVYDAIAAAGFIELIPIDNRRSVERARGSTGKRPTLLVPRGA